MVHTVDSPTVHLPPTVLETDGKRFVEEYDSPDYEGAGGEELLPGSPPAREQSFSAHYDELFELSTDSDDEYDDKPLNSEEVRVLTSHLITWIVRLTCACHVVTVSPDCYRLCQCRASWTRCHGCSTG